MPAIRITISSCHFCLHIPKNNNWLLLSRFPTINEYYCHFIITTLIIINNNTTLTVTVLPNKQTVAFSNNNNNSLTFHQDDEPHPLHPLDLQIQWMQILVDFLQPKHFSVVHTCWMPTPVHSSRRCYPSCRRIPCTEGPSPGVLTFLRRRLLFLPSV